MAIDYKELRGRAGTFLSGFSSGQKAMSVLAVIGLVIGGLLFSRWASKPSYEPLFTNLESSDAAAMTEKLSSAKIPYQLADGGHTILVPAGDVYQQRLDMSAAGLPQGNAGGGYSLLDKEGVTSSEFRQRVDYQRALEGELAKTIESIDGVAAASVHLVIPPSDVFSDSTSKPSASVLVKTTAGRSLTPDQAQAIVHLVSSSVEGLDAGQVTLADAKGVVLAAPGKNGFGMTAGSGQDQQTQDYQNNLAARVQGMLTQVLGPGHAVVQVNADLDFDQRQTTTDHYATPTDRTTPVPVLSEQTSRETFKGTGAPPAGVLGSTTGATTTAGANSNYDKQTATRDFGVDHITSQVVSAPGQVRRLSVAVLLDAASAGDPAEIQKVVTAATGLDPKRGDLIQVTKMAFDDSAAKQAATDLKKVQAARQKTQMVSYGRTAGTLLLVVVILFLGLRSVRKGAPQRVQITIPPRPELEARRLVEQAIERPEAAIEAANARSIVTAAESERRGKVRAEIGELIERQPDEVATLLRGWLADRRSD